MSQTIKLIKLLGMPFEKMNCWDLVEYYFQLNGIKLDGYNTYCPPPKTPWVEIEMPKKGCVLAFDLKGRGNVTHVGIYLGGGEFIHSTEYAGVCVEKLARYLNRLVGMYEYMGGEAVG